MVCLPQIISEGVVAVLDEILPIGWSTVVGANDIVFSAADYHVVSSINRPTHKVDPGRYGIPDPSRPVPFEWLPLLLHYRLVGLA